MCAPTSFVKFEEGPYLLNSQNKEPKRLVCIYLCVWLPVWLLMLILIPLKVRFLLLFRKVLSLQIVLGCRR